MIRGFDLRENQNNAINNIIWIINESRYNRGFLTISKVHRHNHRTVPRRILFQVKSGTVLMSKASDISCLKCINSQVMKERIMIICNTAWDMTEFGTRNDGSRNISQNTDYTIRIISLMHKFKKKYQKYSGTNHINTIKANEQISSQSPLLRSCSSFTLLHYYQIESLKWYES